MPNVVNQNSLMVSVDSFDGSVNVKTKDTRVVVTKFMIVDPDGTSDEVRYSSWLEAVRVLMDCQGIGDKLTKAMNADGVYESAYRFDFDNDDKITDWLMEYAEQVLKENGYRIVSIHSWKV